MNKQESYKIADTLVSICQKDGNVLGRERLIKLVASHLQLAYCSGRMDALAEMGEKLVKKL